MTTPANTTPAVTAPVNEKTITDNVLGRINAMQSAGALTIPADYNVANALKAAWFVLLETKTSKSDGGRPVLEVCSKDSIANSLFKMVTNAWNPAKKQCYFIPYGTALTCQGSYQGNKANARRVGMKDVAAQVIYKGDVFKYEIDPRTGRKRLVEHTQSFENIDLGKILGAYVVVEMEGGNIYLDVMTMAQIKNAWEQGQGEGKVHKNFTDKMCEKTIISRACTAIINASDDSHLEAEENENPAVLDATHEEISSAANTQPLSLAAKTEPIEVKVVEKEKVETDAPKVNKEGQVDAGF